MGPIQSFMTDDHERLDALLRASERADGSIDEAPYVEFREGLLRHIGMEEKVLLPFCRDRRGEPLAIAAKLRADHGAIAKLLVRTPTRDVIDELRDLLGRHNPLEEGPGGLYATCDALAGDEAAAVVAKLRERPQVPLAEYYDGSIPPR